MMPGIALPYLAPYLREDLKRKDSAASANGLATPTENVVIFGEMSVKQNCAVRWYSL